MDTNMVTLAAEHSRDACYYGERGEWLIVLSRHRDSDCLTQSNFESALAALGGEGEHVAIERSNHWAVGWVEYLVVDPAQGEIVAQAQEMRDRLEDYPVLDEENWSKRECDEYMESWESWGRSEYQNALKSRLYDGDNEESERLQLLKEACDDLDNEQIDELRSQAAQSVNWEYQAEGSGVTINISGLANCTDIEKVIEMCDELIAENQRSADIKRLAFHLGASLAQAQEAVALDIRSVSGLQQLMQGSI
jgi:hypothetical protein